MKTQIALFAVAAGLSGAAGKSAALPPRYKNGLYGATFFSGTENGGSNGEDYQEVFIQAINGSLVFTRNPPTRICPCADSFGAKNFTGYYIGGTDQAPTVQLFTSSPGAQYVYIAQDLSIKYTLPGVPVPWGANATSITLYDPEPLGGLPSQSSASIEGHVTHADGKRTYYNNFQFCAPAGSPPGSANGIGPLSISACPTENNEPGGKGIVGDNCIDGYFLNSINDPPVAPWDINYRTPSQPLAYAYAN